MLLLKVKQVAKLLNVSATVVYELVSAKLLPCYRIGRPRCRGAIRVAEADVMAYLESLKTQKKPEAKPPAHRPKIKLQHLHLPD